MVRVNVTLFDRLKKTKLGLTLNIIPNICNMKVMLVQDILTLIFCAFLPLYKVILTMQDVNMSCEAQLFSLDEGTSSFGC